MNFEDFLVSSNNSINDNKVNAIADKKSARSPIRQLKKLIKCLVKRNKNTYKKNPQPTYYMDDEVSDNLSNEILENEIFEEIDSCSEYSGVQIYTEDGSSEFLPITKGQRYIPVHFARTEAGTFFWATAVQPDSDICTKGDENAICSYQKPQEEVRGQDRWAQA